MSHSIDYTTEDALSVLFDTDFYNSLKQYLGYPTTVANSDLPFDIDDLLAEAVSIVEALQWRCIRRKEITLLLPVEAFCHSDNAFYVPFGTISVVDIDTFVSRLSDGTSLSVDTSVFIVQPTSPTTLVYDDWLSLFGDYDTTVNEPIKLIYETGYSAYNEIPRSTIIAIKLQCAHLMKEREIITNPDAISGFSKGGAFDTYVNIDMLYSPRATKYLTVTK